MAAELILKGLPKPWNFGITQDGRIFFIDDIHQVTTWLHPATCQPVSTGHESAPDLPPSWELGITNSGIPYYIDHINQETTFVHPVTKKTAVYAEAIHSPIHHKPKSLKASTQLSTQPFTMELRRSMRKKGHANLCSPHVVRSNQSPITMEGWLHKQDSRGLKQWKKRWFVLSDYCLFYYKGPGEDQNVGSILLPSYKINPCTSEDKISRKYAFKAEHQNMRTYYFAAESKELMTQWMNSMSLATILQKHSNVNNSNKIHQNGYPKSIDEEDSGFHTYKHRTSHVIDPNSTLNSSMISDSVPRDNFSCDGVNSGLDSGNFSCYESRNKLPVSDRNANDCSPNKMEHLYVNAPPKPHRFNAPFDESQFELYPDENMQFSYQCGDQHPADDQFRNQLRMKSDAFFPDVTRDNHIQRNVVSNFNVYPGYNDSLVRNNHFDKSASRLSHQHRISSPSSQVTLRQPMVARSYQAAPPLPKKGMHRPLENDNSSSLQLDEYRNGSGMIDGQLNSLNHASGVPIQSDKNYRDEYAPNYHNNDSPISHNNSSQMCREDYARASTRSLGNAISRGRPTSSYYRQNESQELTPRQLTRDDSFTVRMDKGHHEKAEIREASMKRLLEWKQRMLQSPLSRNHRKPFEIAPIETLPQRPPLPDGYHEQVLKELVSHENAALKTITDVQDYSQTLSGVKRSYAQLPQKQIELGSTSKMENERLLAVKIDDKYRDGNHQRSDRLLAQQVARPNSRTQDWQSSSSLNRSKECSSGDEDDPHGQRRSNRHSSHLMQKKNQSSQLNKIQHNPSTKQHREYVNIINGGIDSLEYCQRDPNASANNVSHETLPYPSSEYLTNQLNAEPVHQKNEFNSFHPSNVPLTAANKDEYNANVTYDIGEDGLSKEELRYAQELLYQKYEQKKKNSSLSSYKFGGNNRNVNQQFDPNLNQFPEQNSDEFHASNMNQLSINTSIEMNNSQNIHHYYGTDDHSGKNFKPKQLFPSPDGIDHCGQGASIDYVNPFGEVMNVSNQSLPSPQYHHLQYELDENTDDRPLSVSYMQQNHVDVESQRPKNLVSDIRKFENTNKAYSQGDYVFQQLKPSANQESTNATTTILPSSTNAELENRILNRTPNSYENVSSTVELPNMVNNDFQIAYKSKFGQETAGSCGIVSNTAKEKEPDKMESFLKKSNTDELKRYSETMMYKLTHDSTLNHGMTAELNNIHDLKEDVNDYKSDIPIRPNFSVKELRESIKKVKEAPPANIVQQRIKHFEISTKQTVSSSPAPESVDVKDPSLEKTSPRRRFYSDSEAVLYPDSSSESDVGRNQDQEKAEDAEQFYISMQPKISNTVHAQDKHEPIYISMEENHAVDQNSKPISYPSNYPIDNNFSNNVRKPIFQSSEPQVCQSLRVYHCQVNNNVSQASLKYPIELKPPRHFRDSSQYSETDSRMSVQSYDSAGRLKERNFDSNESFLKGNNSTVEVITPSSSCSLYLDARTLINSEKALFPESTKNYKFNPSEKMLINDVNLPDLLKHEEGEESVLSESNAQSICSDADDEASKDFESVPVKKQFQSKLHFWFNKDKRNKIDVDTDSEKDSIPSYPPPPPPPTLSTSQDSTLKDYYEFHLNDNKKLSEDQLPLDYESPDVPGHHNDEGQSIENISESERPIPQGEENPESPSEYSHLRVYEDDRRSTQFLMKPFSGTETKKPKLLVKKLRIYDEGKSVDNVKNRSPDPIFPKNDTVTDSLPNLVQEDDEYVGLRLPSISMAASPPDNSSAVEDRSASEKSEGSPSSAPYYYSDLLKNGTQIPDNVNHNSPRLSTRSVPNNIRTVSPPEVPQADIGRRVNLIHQQESQHLNAELENNLRYTSTNPSEITPELRCSLEQILGSQSKKFSDLERNRYEAGNTLEKTRHLDNNKLKLRSATPDFDITTNRHIYGEDFHHSMSLQNHNLLSRRLSRSMEDLLDSSPSSIGTAEILRRPVVTKAPPPIPPPKPLRSSEPYYENSAHLKRMSNLEISQEEHNRDLARRGLSPTSSNDARPQAYPAKHSISTHDLAEQTAHIPNYSGKTSYLKEESAKQFQSREQTIHPHVVNNTIQMQPFLESRLPNPDTGPDIPTFDNSLTSSINHFLGVGQKSDFKGGGESTDNLIESEVANITSAQILSSAQSSCSSLEEVHPSRNLNQLIDSGLASYKNHDNQEAGRGVKCDNVSDSEVQMNASSKLRRLVRQSEGLSQKGKRLSISAGELLGKTHEELVLLLIQLRRNQTKIVKARDQCRKQLDNIKTNVNMDSNDIFMLQQQYGELDNQSEATRPLINLVDNMVKLGSLYGGSDQMLASQYKLDEPKDYIPPKAMIEFSRKMQEKKLVQGSREELNNMTPEEIDLEEKLQQLFRLDRELQEESVILSNFQNDKEILERTLEGMKKKVGEANCDMEKDKLKKQQKLLEKELFKLKTSLANSVKRLEDKTTENSRVEHEILILRQKIHQSLVKSTSMKSSNASTSKLQAELTRVQAMLDELADRRKELNNAVNKFKMSSSLVDVRASPTGIAGSAALPGKKKPCTTYLETDMDTYVSIDVGSGITSSQWMEPRIFPPIYVNTENVNTSSQTGSFEPQDISEADDKMKRFYGIIPKEKPSEIKTVRIVKREAGRRSKDKKKVTYDDSSLVQVIESNDTFEEDEEEEECAEDPGQLTRSMTLPRNFNSRFNQTQNEHCLSAHERLFGGSNSSIASSPVKLKPPEVIKKVSIKRPKRRHHTIIGSSQTLPTSSNVKMPQSRSRDDLDMEHCLRTVNTPDVVKSTIKKSDVFDHDTIDRELGLPQKISIPERYVNFEPEPQLSTAEQLIRSQKAASIRKMLSESAQYDDMVSDRQDCSKPTETLKKKMGEERRRREQLLALNQAIAKEVIQKSKYVAGNGSSQDFE